MTPPNKNTKCPDCRGTGIVDDGYDGDTHSRGSFCDTCNGTGKVKEEITPTTIEKLREEFVDKFTSGLIARGFNLNNQNVVIGTVDEVWSWILQNFTPNTTGIPNKEYFAWCPNCFDALEAIQHAKSWEYYCFGCDQYFEITPSDKGGASGCEGPSVKPQNPPQSDPKTDIGEFLDTLIAEVRMWALNHEGNIAKIHPIYTEAKQAIEALLSHQREELLDLAISLLWKSHRDEPEPEDEDPLNPGLDLAIQKLTALREKEEHG